MERGFRSQWWSKFIYPNRLIAPLPGGMRNRSIKTGLGGAKYYPKSVHADSGEEQQGFLAANVGISEEIFLELLAQRHELRQITLAFVGEKIDLDWGGYASWSYDDDQKARLYILGFSYSSASPAEQKQTNN
jgi:hypothetical protein